MTATAYFGPGLLQQLEDALVYNAFTDSFAVGEKCPAELRELMDSLVAIKEIEEDQFGNRQVNEEEERAFLRGEAVDV